MQPWNQSTAWCSQRLLGPMSRWQERPVLSAPKSVPKFAPAKSVALFSLGQTSSLRTFEVQDSPVSHGGAKRRGLGQPLQGLIWTFERVIQTFNEVSPILALVAKNFRRIWRKCAKPAATALLAMPQFRWGGAAFPEPSILHRTPFGAAICLAIEFRFQRFVNGLGRPSSPFFYHTEGNVTFREMRWHPVQGRVCLWPTRIHLFHRSRLFLQGDLWKKPNCEFTKKTGGLLKNSIIVGFILTSCDMENTRGCFGICQP